MKFNLLSNFNFKTIQLNESSEGIGEHTWGREPIKLALTGLNCSVGKNQCKME